MKWDLNNHITGKVYDLTQENMNAMIADIEMLQDKLEESNIFINDLLEQYTRIKNESISDERNKHTISELQDKLYHSSREVEEVKYISNHKLAIAVEALEHIKGHYEGIDFYFGDIASEVLAKIRGEG